jgi:hypothetical protein
VACHNEQFVAINSECYNERGEILFIMESSIIFFSMERLFMLFMCVRLFMLFIRESLFIVLLFKLARAVCTSYITFTF